MKRPLLGWVGSVWKVDTFVEYITLIYIPTHYYIIAKPHMCCLCCRFVWTQCKISIVQSMYEIIILTFLLSHLHVKPLAAVRVAMFCESVQAASVMTLKAEHT